MNSDASPALADADLQPVSTGAGRTWLALAIVAGVLLTGVSAWRQGWFTPTSHVFLELAGANGVQLGTPVRLRGFKIGEVDNITLDRNLSVRARLRLDADRMELLGGDARARFGRDSPIASKYIEIQPGRRDGPRLASGKVLPVDAGSELDDVMLTLRLAAEQLSTTLAKIDPILEDARKLSGEAVAGRETARAAITDTLANVRTISAEIRQTSQTARALALHLDQDRYQLVEGSQGVLRQAAMAASSAGASLAALQSQLPGVLSKADEVLDNTRAVSLDLKQVLAESRGDIPPLVRSGRAAAEDASDISAGLKGSWPLSRGNAAAVRGPLPLDSFEAVPR